jgi:UDP-glucose 4-epimerase
MRYLVTGGCGFIGSHIAEAIVQHDGDAGVVVFDSLRSGFRGNIGHLADRVEFVHGDIRDRPALDAAMDGIDFVFHEAALVSVFESVEQPGLNQGHRPKIWRLA